jgi:chorismate mutase
MSAITLTLGRDGMGNDATEADFGAWVGYVCDHIDAACGLEVDVDEALPRDVQSTTIRGASLDEADTIRQAVSDLWEQWCAEGATVSDERVAAILTDTSRFHARVRALWTEAGQAGDTRQVELCRLALDGDEAAAEKCARVLAEAVVEAQS